MPSSLPRRYTNSYLPDDVLSVNDTQSITYDVPVMAENLQSTPAPSDSESESHFDLALPPLLIQDTYTALEPSLTRGTSLPGVYDPSPSSSQPAASQSHGSSYNPHFFDAKSLPVSLQAVLSNYTYWMDLVSRLGFDPVIYQAETPTLETLSRYFDCSSRGLLRVFHLFDKDHDQVLTFAEIARGLQQQALFTNAGSETGEIACLELCELIVTRGTRDVRPPEFLWALKNLRLAALLTSSCGIKAMTSEPDNGLNEVGRLTTVSGPEDWQTNKIHSSHSVLLDSLSLSLCLHVLEYRADRLLTRSPLDSPVYFLFQPGLSTTEGMDVRWVHLHDADRQAILGVAIKYGLDPRYVLDVFYLWREQARCDKMNYFAPQLITGEVQVLFVIVPVLRLTERAQMSLQEYRLWKTAKKKGRDDSQPPTVIVEIEHCNVAFFVAGKQGNVLSFSSEWGTLSKLVTDDLVTGDISSLMRAKTLYLSSDLDSDQGLSEHDVHPDLRVFPKVLKDLQTSYSVLRTGDSHTFLLKSMCEITDDYREVNEAYVAGLYILQKRLERKKNLMTMEDMRKIRKGSRQLSHLYRLVRPMVNVAEVLQNLKFGGDSPLYISEIHTNVSAFLEATLTNRSLCKQLMDDFHNFSESHLSSVVFALTIVFSVCAPGQFVASIYGMNFSDEHGPTIPELSLKRGYMYYWLTSAFLTALVGLYMYYKRKIGWTQ